jgi:hypothetical protein
MFQMVGCQVCLGVYCEDNRDEEEGLRKEGDGCSLYLSMCTSIKYGATRRYHVLQGVCPKELLFRGIADRGWIAEGRMGCCLLVATACELTLLLLHESALARPLLNDPLAMP